MSDRYGSFNNFVRRRRSFANCLLLTASTMLVLAVTATSAPVKRSPGGPIWKRVLRLPSGERKLLESDRQIFQQLSIIENSRRISRTTAGLKDAVEICSETSIYAAFRKMYDSLPKTGSAPDDTTVLKLSDWNANELPPFRYEGECNVKAHCPDTVKGDMTPRPYVLKSFVLRRPAGADESKPDCHLYEVVEVPVRVGCPCGLGPAPGASPLPLAESPNQY